MTTSCARVCVMQQVLLFCPSQLGCQALLFSAIHALLYSFIYSRLPCPALRCHALPGLARSCPALLSAIQVFCLPCCAPPRYLCFALLCPALPRSAWLRFALLYFAALCLALFGCALLCSPLQGSISVCYALLGATVPALLCSVVLCASCPKRVPTHTSHLPNPFPFGPFG